MTEIEHLKVMVGDLVVTVAQQAAAIDALQAQLAAARAAAVPATEPQP